MKNKYQLYFGYSCKPNRLLFETVETPEPEEINGAEAISTENPDLIAKQAQDQEGGLWARLREAWTNELDRCREEYGLQRTPGEQSGYLRELAKRLSGEAQAALAEPDGQGMRRMADRYGIHEISWFSDPASIAHLILKKLAGEEASGTLVENAMLYLQKGIVTPDPERTIDPEPEGIGPERLAHLQRRYKEAPGPEEKFQLLKQAALLGFEVAQTVTSKAWDAYRGIVEKYDLHSYSPEPKTGDRIHDDNYERLVENSAKWRDRHGAEVVFWPQNERDLAAQFVWALESGVVGDSDQTLDRALALAERTLEQRKPALPRVALK